MKSSPLAFCLFVFGVLFISSAGALEKWLYSPTNLQVDENVDKLRQLWRRAADAGYTHILLTDSKMAKLGDLGEMTSHYFANAERVKKLAADLKLELVPALFDVGYSNNILWHDPNLIEAMPVKNVPLLVRDGVARVADSELPTLPGGDFSDLKKWSWVDATVVADNGTARITNPKGANARLSQKLKVLPFRQYHVSVRVKTQDFKGSPEIKALPASGASLTWDNLGVKPTQDWTTHHAVFNSQNNTEVSLFFGTWGAQTGSLWWDDAKVEEVAFLNLTRRPGTPLVITTSEGKRLVEKDDYEPLQDPLLGTKPWPGSYTVYHEAPLLRTKLPDGTKLLASYYHGVTVYDGQAMICPSEPKTYDLLRDNAKRVHAAFGAKNYMMSHDEIRVLNWCEACQKRKMTPGQILADNVKQCIAMLREIAPGARIHVWNDMFDPNHNAVPGPYYLVNGDLTGSWEGLDSDVVIVPWYFEKRSQSLEFFARRGHKQVIAGYYDSRPERIVDWLTAAKPVSESVIGVMYTTWKNDYKDIEKFAASVDSTK